jgi:hypothetical protein
MFATSATDTLRERIDEVGPWFHNGRRPVLGDVAHGTDDGSWSRGLAWWRSKMALAVQPCSSSARTVSALARKVTRARPRIAGGFCCVTHVSKGPAISPSGF